MLQPGECMCLKVTVYLFSNLTMLEKLILVKILNHKFFINMEISYKIMYIHDYYVFRGQKAVLSFVSIYCGLFHAQQRLGWAYQTVNWIYVRIEIFKFIKRHSNDSHVLHKDRPNPYKTGSGKVWLYSLVLHNPNPQ